MFTIGEIKMAIYYIDPVNGKSENSGLSENEPILTNENLDVKLRGLGANILIENEI